jgi:hypothetical protein
MAEKSSFFNSIGNDRRYKAEDWAAYFATFVGNGVVLKTNAALAVSADAGSMSVSLGAGSAFINGYRYENTAALSLALQTAHASLNRIDAVMVRWNRSLRAMNAYIVTGTPALNPQAQAPARTADIHELCVAHVFVAAGATSVGQSAIDDRRLDSAICGLATMIGEVDTSTLYAQIQADLAAFRADEQADFAAWFAGVQATLGSDTAGNLLNLIQYHAPVVLTVSLPASGWSASAPYTQTVNAAGMLTTDAPLADVVLSATAATAKAQLEAYGYIGRIDTGSGQITVTCYEDKPAVDLTLVLKVVR